MSNLIREAKIAEDIADAFGNFRRPNPRHAQDINAAISALAGLSWALREIVRLLAEDGTQLDKIEKDLQMAHRKIALTLDEIWLIIGGIGDGRRDLVDEDFQHTWELISRYCVEVGRDHLHIRLEVFRRFVLALCNFLKRELPTMQEFKSLQQGVQALDIRPTQLWFNAQKKRVDLGTTVAKKPEPIRIVERRPEPEPEFRPDPPPFQRSASHRIARPRSYERHRSYDREPLSPTDSTGSRPPFVPPAPNIMSPPLSPTTTFSTISHTSSLDRELSDYWTKTIMLDTSSTILPMPAEPSQYHDGVSHAPECRLPDDRYEVALSLNFPPSLVASFYRRPSDRKAKMVITQSSRSGRITRCIPLSALDLHRSGSVLRFCHTSRDRKTRIAWVSLQFSTIERLVLFACTFVALRTFSGAKPDAPLWNDEHKDEVEEFKGVITDAKYSYDLRLYRDRPSKAIRLQATRRGGDLDRTPIWTAFVTNLIMSPTWCQRVEKKAIFLNELRSHIFKTKYALEKAPSGAYILRFDTSTDAKAFVNTVGRLREKMVQPPRR